MCMYVCQERWDTFSFHSHWWSSDWCHFSFLGNVCKWLSVAERLSQRESAVQEESSSLSPISSPNYPRRQEVSSHAAARRPQKYLIIGIFLSDLKSNTENLPSFTPTGGYAPVTAVLSVRDTCSEVIYSWLKWFIILFPVNRVRLMCNDDVMAEFLGLELRLQHVVVKKWCLLILYCWSHITPWGWGYELHHPQSSGPPNSPSRITFATNTPGITDVFGKYF